MNGDPSTRVLDFSECLALREQAREEGRRIVLTNGCFDLLHRGHLEYLYQSAVLGDFLIVAVNSDESVRALKGETRPIHKEEDRAYALASLRVVDAAFVFPGPRLVEEIRSIRPEIYTKAGDYTPDSLDRSEYAALIEVAAEIRILPFISGHSTTTVIDRMGQ